MGEAGVMAGTQGRWDNQFRHVLPQGLGAGIAERLFRRRIKLRDPPAFVHLDDAVQGMFNDSGFARLALPQSFFRLRLRGDVPEHDGDAGHFPSRPDRQVRKQNVPCFAPRQIDETGHLPVYDCLSAQCLLKQRLARQPFFGAEDLLQRMPQVRLHRQFIDLRHALVDADIAERAVQEGKSQWPVGEECLQQGQRLLHILFSVLLRTVQNKSAFQDKPRFGTLSRFWAGRRKGSSPCASKVPPCRKCSG